MVRPSADVVRRQVELWVLYLGAAVLLVTGFYLLFHGVLIGAVHVVVGLGVAIVRVRLGRRD